MITQSVTSLATVGGATVVAVCVVLLEREQKRTRRRRTHIRALLGEQAPDFQALLADLDRDFRPPIHATRDATGGAR